MASSDQTSKWLAFSVTLAVATISASAAISVYFGRRKSSFDVKENKIQELEASLKSSLEKCNAERQGRIRAQQALRKSLVQIKSDNLEWTSYPMAPIAIIQSCFSTRNGTPRQPLLVPLARARLLFDPVRVPPASLEGLEEYSHCWIIYVFHLNTNLEKLWKHPSKSKFKAKVRVPRLEGGKMGLFATRSPHRPCPIGLTVAKVEAVHEHMVLLSGVDLVDGTPVLDIKPYLPYCDGIQGATVPTWVKADNVLAVASVSFSDSFNATLADCWTKLEKKSIYASPDEFQSLIKQVLSWDIRSLSQRSRPHNSIVNTENDVRVDSNTMDVDDDQDEAATNSAGEGVSLLSSDIIYHLTLEGLDVSYRMVSDGNVVVEKVTLPSHIAKQL
ncbi:tRNA (adenine(37)-N6)-methyltransferase [Camellia lanceoleosa]|uniref:tRNA (Adenine(37)-N6)-methyltransferase n=1 Tax=Camellia lanceoleosa TaxID=1840588 RepID=A0ACC0I648_9ERIC|nr:tRNA (adenine(37)-N6)-methyltransferase [Camellia lanceoleosa]